MSDSPQPLLIGVDGGGSGCRAAIGTPASGIIGRAEGGPANASSDPDLAIKNIRHVVEAAAEAANILPSDLKTAHAHLGLAGVKTQQGGDRISSALPYASCAVTEDIPTAVTGALGGRDGYVLAIGTGTIIARAKGGAFQSVNGWGFHISDQASGAWLGRAALEQVLLCHDKLAEFSDLTRSIFASFGSDPNEIVAFSMTSQPVDFAKFAPNVVNAAQSGDAVAQELMERGADFLVRGLAALQFLPGDPICLTGGVGPLYSKYLPGDSLAGSVPCQGSALDGAFELARAGYLKMHGAQT